MLLRWMLLSLAALACSRPISSPPGVPSSSKALVQCRSDLDQLQNQVNRLAYQAHQLQQTQVCGKLTYFKGSEQPELLIFGFGEDLDLKVRGPAVLNLYPCYPGSPEE